MQNKAVENNKNQKNINHFLYYKIENGNGECA